MLRRYLSMGCLSAMFFFTGCFGTAKAESPKKIINSIGMELVLIPKGTFTMGSPPSEEGSDDNERQHEVTISKGYYFGIYEVTQAQYEKVMGVKPSYFQGDMVAERHPETGRIVNDVDSSKHPVESVSWEHVVEFCRRLSAFPAERSAGRIYRLPSEAEWEYACRAGTTTAFSTVDKLTALTDAEEANLLNKDQDLLSEDEKEHMRERFVRLGLLPAGVMLAGYGWFEGNSNGQTHPVGSKKANAWGLHDMHGNVWEWCSDEFGKGTGDSLRTSAANEEVPRRVLRGGSFGDETVSCRSANRYSAEQTDGGRNVGFRVAVSVSGLK